MMKDVITKEEMLEFISKQKEEAQQMRKEIEFDSASCIEGFVSQLQELMEEKPPKKDLAAYNLIEEIGERIEAVIKENRSDLSGSLKAFEDIIKIIREETIISSEMQMIDAYMSGIVYSNPKIFKPGECFSIAKELYKQNYK